MILILHPLSINYFSPESHPIFSVDHIRHHDFFPRTKTSPGLDVYKSYANFNLDCDSDRLKDNLSPHSFPSGINEILCLLPHVFVYWLLLFLSQKQTPQHLVIETFP